MSNYYNPPNYLNGCEVAVFESVDPHPFQMLLTREEVGETHLVQVSDWVQVKFTAQDSRLAKLLALSRSIDETEAQFKEKLAHLTERLNAIRNAPLVDSSIDMAGNGE